MQDANRTQSPYIKALSCSAIALVAGLVALFLGFRLPSFTTNSEAASQLVALAAVPGLIVGLLAKKSTRPWPLWLIIVAFIIILIAVTIAHEMTAEFRS